MPHFFFLRIKNIYAKIAASKSAIAAGIRSHSQLGRLLNRAAAAGADTGWFAFAPGISHRGAWPIGLNASTVGTVVFVVLLYALRLIGWPCCWPGLPSEVVNACGGAMYVSPPPLLLPPPLLFGGLFGVTQLSPSAVCPLGSRISMPC